MAKDLPVKDLSIRYYWRCGRIAEPKLDDTYYCHVCGAEGPTDCFPKVIEAEEAAATWAVATQEDYKAAHTSPEDA